MSENIHNETTVKCRKCGATVKIRFGGLTREEAEQRVEQLDRLPMECPGFHVELGHWKYYWRLDEAIEQVYGPQPAIT